MRGDRRQSGEKQESHSACQGTAGVTGGNLGESKKAIQLAKVLRGDRKQSRGEQEGHLVCQGTVEMTGGNLGESMKAIQFAKVLRGDRKQPGGEQEGHLACQGFLDPASITILRGFLADCFLRSMETCSLLLDAIPPAAPNFLRTLKHTTPHC